MSNTLSELNMEQAKAQETEQEQEQEAETTEASLQQLKAKKNKSNLFLIKSYSFIERNNNNNNNLHTNKNNKNAKISTVSAPASELLKSPDMEAFPDIASLMLADKPKKQTRLKKSKQAKVKTKSKAKTEQQLEEPDAESEQQLLRRHNVQEYEQLLQQLATLPRPQSLPAKVHFDLLPEPATQQCQAQVVAAGPPNSKRSSSTHIKRESFLRQSLQSIRRSFSSNKQAGKLALPSPTASSNASSSASSSSTTSSCCSSTALTLLSKAQAHNHQLDQFLPTPVLLLLNNQLDADADADADTVDAYQRSASTLANGNTGLTIDATNSMAPLQSPANGAATATATTTAAALNAHQQQQQQQQQQLLQQQQQQLQLRRQHYCQQLSLPESFAGEDNNSLPQSYSTSINPAQPNAGAGSGSAQSLVSSASPSPSPSSSNSNSQGRSKSSSHNNSNNNNGKGLNTAKQHEQQSGGTMAGNSNSVAAVAAGNGTPPEKDKDKEKKRKEVSSSRVKKFHRHFSQVSKDEKLINYFSCALVGDIPLQGHLYITDQHFAFYSNVFGYVTKVVIPTSSVTKISKEKTAKIIPNAVGVSTADERHVFNSFISREAAFRLMCTVCVQLANGIESLPKPLPLDDVELTEEYLMDDDSSCSISGNESPPQRALGASAEPEDDGKPQAMLRQRIRHSDPNKSLLGAEAHGSLSTRSSAPPVVHYETPVASSLQGNSRSASATASAASSGTPSTSSSPTTVMGVADNSPPTPTRGPQGSKLSRLAHSVRSRLSLPTLTELHVLYLGILLAILLALFSVFLLYRILDIEAKTSLYNTPVDFNARLGSDEDIFAEALRWQKELQDKSHAETQHILSKNLEQITKVRRSLETLSMLINDRRTGYAAAQAAAAASPSLAAAANHISGNRDDSSD